MTSQVAVVDIPSDPDDTATPPSLRKRSHAALAAPSPDSLEDFSPFPPLTKRRPPASLIVLDDTPTPPKQRPSVALERHVSGVAETRQSVVPCSLGSRAVVAETPNSVLPCSSRFRAAASETPGSAVPCSIGSDIVVAVTPGFTSPRSAGPPAAPGLPSAAFARNLSGVSCPISLDSDDELDVRPLTKLPSNTTKSEPVIQPGTTSCFDKVDSATSTDQDYSKPSAGHQTTFSAHKNGGTTSYGQPADLPCEDSSLQDADVSNEKYNPKQIFCAHQDERHSETKNIGRERSSAQTAARRRQQEGDKSHRIEEGKQKQQEEKKRQKEENARLVEEKKKKQQEEKRLKKEEKARLIEERKQKQQENKMQKEAMKAQLAEVKKLDKEKRQWESGKFASKSIVTKIDSSVIESGSVGGHLLSRFAEKGLSFRVTPNAIRGSILWKMEVPEELSQELSQPQASVLEVPYILIVLQAEEFCDLVSSGSFLDHVHKVRSHYPTFTICYVTNKLMNYIKKREQSQYKNPSNSNSWKRPPVEEVLCKLSTHYVRVHSRQCADEGEVAEHVVGLTSSLATCKFRQVTFVR